MWPGLSTLLSGARACVYVCWVLHGWANVKGVLAWFFGGILQCLKLVFWGTGPTFAQASVCVCVTQSACLQIAGPQMAGKSLWHHGHMLPWIIHELVHS
jgi:hypothetical protein